MNIRDALLESKANGKTYSRTSINSRHYTGWIAWDDAHEYEGLNADDLTADDWELSHIAIEKLTGGKWTSNDLPNDLG